MQIYHKEISPQSFQNQLHGQENKLVFLTYFSPKVFHIFSHMLSVLFILLPLHFSSQLESYVITGYMGICSIARGGGYIVPNEYIQARTHHLRFCIGVRTYVTILDITAFHRVSLREAQYQNSLFRLFLSFSQIKIFFLIKILVKTMKIYVVLWQNVDHVSLNWFLFSRNSIHMLLHFHSMNSDKVSTEFSFFTVP